MAEMIAVKGLCKAFEGVEVLRDVSFGVEHGETVSVIGPSGTGKSTMLRCLIALEQADAGDIFIEGRPLMQNGEMTRARREAIAPMGMVFQNFNLFPHMSVLKNLICAPVENKELSRDEAAARARELLRQVGLSDKEDQKPGTLSGGQAQRVAIARALMRNPDILLFDEPTSALDPQLTGEVLSVMRDLHESKMTMLVVTHEMGFARASSDRVLFMADGGIVMNAPPERVFESPEDERVKSFIRSILTL